jgi:hypothetical protein
MFEIPALALVSALKKYVLIALVIVIVLGVLSFIAGTSVGVP